MGFQVVIVGGSISGLTLANILERFDIDYVLLEGHTQIAPQLGASIGLLPSGLRILDQVALPDQCLLQRLRLYDSLGLPRPHLLVLIHRVGQGNGEGHPQV